MEIVAVYTDGGIMGRSNPSAEGGTWAWCGVDAQGRRVIERMGHLLPGGTTETAEWVTNNQTEFYALCKALAFLPDGWSGTLYTDSQTLLARIANARQETKKGRAHGGRCYAENTPRVWMEWFWKHLHRLGPFTACHVPGHAGNEQNEWCDTTCNKMKGWFTEPLWTLV